MWNRICGTVETESPCIKTKYDFFIVFYIIWNQFHLLGIKYELDLRLPQIPLVQNSTSSTSTTSTTSFWIIIILVFHTKKNYYKSLAVREDQRILANSFKPTTIFSPIRTFSSTASFFETDAINCSFFIQQDYK